MNTYREPGRDVDMTEIERAKIHEAAETNRKTIEERGKTQRAKIQQYGPAGHIVGGLLGFAAIVAGALTASNYFDAAHPKPFKAACVEKVEVISGISDARRCENGGHIETTPLKNDDVLWKCVCGPRLTSDGSAP